MVELDFETRRERLIPAAEAAASCQRGFSCWIDVDLADAAEAEALLKSLGVHHVAIEEALSHRIVGRYDTYGECIHASVIASTRKNGELGFALVDLILGERFLITLHHGPIDFLERVRKEYRHFFQTFAKSLGFLLFEFCDKLIDGHRTSLVRLEEDVEEIHGRILGEVDDKIFTRVSDTTHSLLILRKNVLANREVLHELSVRRSQFVSETTQPYLHNMVGTLERLGLDLTTEREILAESLNLYLGVVSHRTNRLLNRLTIISVIFLPLTFLCGVYGMNFKQNFPELEWDFGYPFFWFLVVLISGSMLLLSWKKRWL